MKTTKIGKHTIPVAESFGELLAAIGAKTGDTIEIVTPQFERPPGEPAPGNCPPGFMLNSETLQGIAPQVLRRAGMRPWNDPHNPEDQWDNHWGDHGQLWLFPGEWYSHLPAGLEVTCIMGEVEEFVPGVTDNDIRFGCLAYGVVLNVEGPDGS
jgi:hypothetical protein